MIINKLPSFFFIALIGVLNSQIIIEDPVVDIGNAWSHHQIESFHFTSHGGFAFLKDGSSWRLHPDNTHWIEKNQEYLMNVPMTFMPDAGTEQYPHRMIVHNDQYLGWANFSVHYLSAPNDDEATTILELDRKEGSFLKITVPIGKNQMSLSLLVNPSDRTVVKKWKKRQKVMIGGIWLPEYDLSEPKDYCSAYQYVLYNYTEGDYIFFAFLPESEK